MCFSVDSRDSLENIQAKWVPEIHHFCPNVPYLLIATKKDLRNDPAMKQVLAREKQSMIKPDERRLMSEKVGTYNARQKPVREFERFSQWQQELLWLRRRRRRRVALCYSRRVLAMFCFRKNI